MKRSALSNYGMNTFLPGCLQPTTQITQTIIMSSGQHPITIRARPLGTLEPLKSNHQARKSSPSRLQSISLRLIPKPTTEIPQRIEPASKGTNDTRPISSYVDASAATPDESVDNIQRDLSRQPYQLNTDKE